MGIRQYFYRLPLRASSTTFGSRTRPRLWFIMRGASSHPPALARNTTDNDQQSHGDSALNTSTNTNSPPAVQDGSSN